MIAETKQVAITALMSSGIQAEQSARDMVSGKDRVERSRVVDPKTAISEN